jgi:hypothetical protein
MGTSGGVPTDSSGVSNLAREESDIDVDCRKDYL